MSLRPVTRKLKAYAFDPSLSTQLETVFINKTTYKIPWEEDLKEGPIGEYLEVIDYDPINKVFYNPIDLNDRYIIANEGLDPSESNPNFHQQMVYAVSMTTILNFEKALGRKSLWADGPKYSFVKQLRLYPHALNEPNAYYSPEKKAILYGYFKNSGENDLLPNGTIFSCLSHDITAHEITHALLDGMFTNFSEPTHPDTLAFHEAFADIVALFQHFTIPEVLIHQMAKTRGDLTSQNLLGQLAQQFGKAIGNYGALRDAIGDFNSETGKWEPRKPNPSDYKTIMEPHKRGAILVSAVFDAFINIYNFRAKDLFRIATNGTGILPDGQLNPDLVKRLASTAAKSASHVLNICIRALDYCPPIDITFGDYLRAIVTADSDLVPDDDMEYRIAFIEAFRKRGIFPDDVKFLSAEDLRYPVLDNNTANVIKPLKFITDNFLKPYKNEIGFINDRETIFKINSKYRAQLHEIFKNKFEYFEELTQLTGIKFIPGNKSNGIDLDNTGKYKFEVHRLALSNRISPEGTTLNQIIINLVQKRKMGKKYDNMIFRGGCTMIIDLNHHSNPDIPLLRYCIIKNIDDENRLARQHSFQKGNDLMGLRSVYGMKSLKGKDGQIKEPFAIIHNL